MERESIGLNSDDLFSGIDMDSENPGSEPLQEIKTERPEALDHHLQILRDWVFNKVGVVYTSLEMGDTFSVEDPLIQSIVTSAPDEVLVEDVGGKTYGEVIGGKIDDRVIAYIEYVKTEIQYIFSYIQDAPTQMREVKNIIDEVRRFHKLEDMPTREEITVRKPLAA